MATATTTKTMGPFQQAANKFKQFAIDSGVPNAAEIKLDGRLGGDWEIALKAIMADTPLRGRFDYGILREVRDDPTLGMSWFRFVGNIGQTFPGPFEFLKVIDARAEEEAEGKPPTPMRVLYNRVCGWPDHW